MDACSYIKARRVWMVASFVGIYIWGLIQTQMLGWGLETTMLVSGIILLGLWLFVGFAGVVMLLAIASCTTVVALVASEFPFDASFILVFLGLVVSVIGFSMIITDIGKETVKDIGGDFTAWIAYYSIIPLFLLISVMVAKICILAAPLVGVVGIIMFSTVTHFILEVYRNPKI